MSSLVFLIDVDNTLIANDEVKNDLEAALAVQLGPALNKRFWEIYEQVRAESGVVNIPLSLSKLRQATPLSQLDEQTYLHVHSLFDNYPFINRLYPHTLETLNYLRTLGLTVIVSDGDMSFQPEKIFLSDLANTVEGRVLIYIHKQQHLDEILHAYPADHYAMIDDKLQILADTKAMLGQRVTTVFVQQGKYATGPKPPHFSPDISTLHIADLMGYNREQFLKA